MESGKQSKSAAEDQDPRPTQRWGESSLLAGRAKFLDTRWTLIHHLRNGNASQSAEAMAELCQRYWYPLYGYVRRSGKTREEAEDLTQEFFTRYLLEQELLVKADRDRGKLRTFLLTVMKRFLIKDWQKGNAEKRGGKLTKVPIDFEEGEARYGHEPVDRTTPDELYERQWATTVLNHVLDALRSEYADRGQETRFDLLQDTLWWNSNESSYASLGDQLGLSENAVKQAVSRLRSQYRKTLKQEIRKTLEVEDEESVERELRHLVGALRNH